LVKVSDEFTDIIVAVKRLLRVFGLAPVVYDESVVTMTQHVVGVGSSGDDDDDDEGLSCQELEETLAVSRLQHYYMKQQEETETGGGGGVSSWKTHQWEVVQANEKALQKKKKKKQQATMLYEDEDDELSQDSFYSTRQEIQQQQQHGTMDVEMENVETNWLPAAKQSQMEETATATSAWETTTTTTPRFNNTYSRQNHHQIHNNTNNNVVTNVHYERSAATTKNDNDDDYICSNNETTSQRIRFESPCASMTTTTNHHYQERAHTSFSPTASSSAMPAEPPATRLGRFDDDLPAAAEESNKDDDSSSSMDIVHAAAAADFAVTSLLPLALGQQSDNDDDEEEEEEDNNNNNHGENKDTILLEEEESDHGVHTATAVNEAPIITDNNNAPSTTMNPSTAVLPSNTAASTAADVFQVGQVVEVEARTWPGINKPGGVGRITNVQCDDDGSSFLYDVSYVLGGRESRVEAVFLSKLGNYLACSPDAENMQSETETEAAEKKRRVSRRIVETSIPAALLEDLAAEGYDVGKENFAAHSRRTGQDRKRKETQATGSTRKRISFQATNDAEPQPSSTAPTKMDIEQTCQLADQWYQERFEAALAGSTIHVVASSLSDSETSQLALLCKHSRGWNGTSFHAGQCLAVTHSTFSHMFSSPFLATIKLSETFNANKTCLCILPALHGKSEDEHNLVGMTRRCKSMQASLAGVQIVTPAWITACLDQKKVVLPPISSIIRSLPMAVDHDDYFTTSHGVAKLAASKKQDSNSLLLGNTAVYLCSAFGTTQGRDMLILLKAAGAEIVTSIPSTKQCFSRKKKLFCICGSNPKITSSFESILRTHIDQVGVVDNKWLFDCISSGMILGVEKYQPNGSSIATELWKLTAEMQQT
jgi:hypothetical protein